MLIPVRVSTHHPFWEFQLDSSIDTTKFQHKWDISKNGSYIAVFDNDIFEVSSVNDTATQISLCEAADWFKNHNQKVPEWVINQITKF